jgi:hypothetical protein
MRFRRQEIRQRIKDRARNTLSRNMISAVKLCLLLTAVYCIIEYIRLYAAPILDIKGEGISSLINAYLSMNWRQIMSIVVINILGIIVLGPLLCSFCGFFIRLTADRKKNVKDEPIDEEDKSLSVGQSIGWFYHARFRNKAISLQLAASLLSIYWHALFIGPPLFFLYYLRGNPNSIYYANSLFIYTTWMLLGFLLAYVKMGTYYPAYFLIAQEPEMPVAAALRDSVKMMRGHAWEFLTYKLSFAPWYFIAAITFGLGLLYIVPYRGTCDALFIRYVDAVSSGENPL